MGVVVQRAWRNQARAHFVKALGWEALTVEERRRKAQQQRTGKERVRQPMTPELDALPALLHQASGRFALALFATAMTLCTALVLPEHAPHWSQIALSVVLGLTAAGAWSISFWWHVVGRGKPLRLSPLIRLFRR
jgi:hypothetical protein